LSDASPPPLPELDQVVIIGPGLLGASLGLSLKTRGYAGRVVGVGRRESTLDQAVQVGAIDRGVTRLEQTLATAEGRGKVLIVIALPVGKFDEAFRSIAPHQRSGLYITDVGSTKQSICASARKLLRDPTAFIPAHPMAGSEKQGPQHADPDLFEGKPCVLTPDADADAKAYEIVKKLWQALGMVLLHMTPADHDRHVAAASHLPHLLAVALIRSVEALGGIELASSGFRDTSRLASSNPPMRVDILASNREAVLGAIDQVQSELQALRKALTGTDTEPMLDMLENAKQFRDGWASREDKS
jgi:prephenate dehydrogenase